MSKRIFVCGLVQESNSFNPKLASHEAFTRTFCEGEALLCGKGGNTIDGIVSTLTARGCTVIPGRAMSAGSGGPVDAAVIEEFRTHTLSALKAAGTVDGVVVSLHGATLSETSDDVCGDLLSAIREAVGQTAVIAAAFDLHGNVTERMARAADFLCGYLTYPHIDHYEVGVRAATLAVDALEGTPLVTVRAAVPFIAPAHAYTTATEPLKSLMDKGHALRESGAIADFSIFQAQPWMNIPEIASTVIVTAKDEATATVAADELAHGLFAIHKELQGAPLATAEEVVRAALENIEDKPVVLVDSADSPNAGACGDCATALEAILPYRDRLRVAFSLNDQAAVERAFALGVGGTGDFTLGASIAPALSRPVTVRDCTVKSLHSGRFVLEGPAERGQPRNIGRSAVLVADGVQILVTTNAQNNGDKQFYRGFGIEPTLCDLVCVKACTSLRAGYEPISAAIYNTATPGAAGPVLTSLPYDRIPTPLYPFAPITEADVTPARRYR